MAIPPAAADRLTFGLGIAVSIASALLYTSSAARDIVVGDTAELITAAITLGVPHAPGYPLFTILGHLFSWLPIGPAPFRVNLLAVACGAATAGVVYLTAWQLTRDRVAAALAAVVLATSPLFWGWSIVAEVFSLNNLLAATLICLLVVWDRRPERTAPLVAAALIGGLALSNQHTIVTLGPAVLFMLWRHRAALLARPRTIATCVAAVLAGLLPYAYVPWAAARQPVVNWGGVASMADLVALFTRASYGTGQLVSTPEYQGGSPWERIAALLASFGPLGGLLVVIGAVEAYRRRRWYFWLVLLAFAFAGPVFVAYANINLAAAAALFVLERFFLLSHVVAAPLVAFGVLLVREIVGRVSAVPRRLTDAAVAVGVLALALGGVLASYGAVDQSRNHVARTFGEDILATLEPGTLLLAGGDEAILPLLFLQAAEGQRADVTLVMMPLLGGDWYVRQVRQRHPDLSLPFDRRDGRSGTMKALVDANQDRPIAVVGNVPDDSLKGAYWFYRRGLVTQVLPMAVDVGLGEMTRENERLLAQYRPPSPTSIRPKTFERGILLRYSFPALQVGAEHEKARRYDEARTWYQRALAIDPDLAEAREGLARVEQAR